MAGCCGHCSPVFACCCPCDNCSMRRTMTSAQSHSWQASFCQSPSLYSACAEQLNAHLPHVWKKDGHVTRYQTDEWRHRMTYTSERWCLTEALSTWDCKECSMTMITGWRWWRSRVAMLLTGRYRYCTYRPGQDLPHHWSIEADHYEICVRLTDAIQSLHQRCSG